MKGKILGLLTIVILISSCGTNKDFHKKHHKHRKWIKVGEKTNPDFAAKEENDKSLKQEVEIEKAEEVVSAEDKASEERVITSSPTHNNETSIDTPKINEDSTAPVSDEAASKEPNQAVVSHDIDSSSNQENEESAITKKTVKQRVKDGRKEIKEKSVGELLLLAVLIALIIIVFSILDGFLKGLLSTILFIFLVLLLLRYFGII